MFYNKIFAKMRPLINVIATLVFVGQLIPFAFGALNQKAPECVWDSLYSYFVFVAYVCSLLIVPIFMFLYNTDFKFVRKKTLKAIVMVVVLLGAYVHLSQVVVSKDFLFTSCVLLIFDFYVMRMLLKN